MKLQIATPSGQREMTDAEQAEFISARPAKREFSESKKEAGNDKLDALIDALISKGVLSDDDAKTIKSGK
jgi:hypothetical protein